MKTKFSTNNKLVIIGNGFDLAHGLKTSYSHFLTGYFNSCANSFRKNASEKQEGYSDDLVEISNLEIEIHDFLDIDDIKRRFLNNAQDRYLITNGFFKELVENVIDNWVDIEAFYYEKVKGIFDLTNSDFLNPKDKLQEKRERHRRRISKLNTEFNQLKEVFLNYLRRQELDIRRIGEIDTFFSKLYKSIEDSGRIHIVNFNYTNKVEKYFDSLKEFEVNFIHGDMLKEDSHIIFGYGDEEDEYYKRMEDLRIDEYFHNFKSFGYARTRNYQRLLDEMKDNKFDVFILGHSCGFSDKVLLKTIFGHSNCEKIHIRYHQWNGSIKGNDYIKKTMQMSILFNDKGQFRERLVNFEESEPLC